MYRDNNHFRLLWLEAYCKQNKIKLTYGGTKTNRRTSLILANGDHMVLLDRYAQDVYDLFVQGAFNNCPEYVKLFKCANRIAKGQHATIEYKYLTTATIRNDPSDVAKANINQELPYINTYLFPDPFIALARLNPYVFPKSLEFLTLETSTNPLLRRRNIDLDQYDEKQLNEFVNSIRIKVDYSFCDLPSYNLPIHFILFILLKIDDIAQANMFSLL